MRAHRFNSSPRLSDMRLADALVFKNNIYAKRVRLCTKSNLASVARSWAP